MLHTKQEKVEKDIIALKKRADVLHTLKYRKKVYKPVEKPFQNGWIIYPALREDALRRADAERMQAALDACSHEHTTTDPKLVSKIRQTRSLEACRKLFYHKGYHYFSWYSGPDVKPLTEKQYNALPEELKCYYYVEETISRWGNIPVRKYHLSAYKLPTYYIILKVKPRMITHLHEPDPEVERELKWINDKLDQMMAWASSYSRKWERKLDIRRMRSAVRAGKRKFVKGELEDIPNEKRSLTCNY